MKILVVIPARGNSKGIPRKNLRLLHGKPLIYYVISTALNSKYNPDVYVSSEDDEILSLAERFGSKVHKRRSCLAKDETTLDPVVYSCYQFAKKKENKEYDLIITIQPTSPLLKRQSLDSAIDRAITNHQIDTIIAARDDTKLSWKKIENNFYPNYEKRLNRQCLPPVFSETGAFLITRNTVITPENRIGKKVDLYILSGGEEIDIDTYEDWNICEYFLKRKHILFVVTGNENVGLGHVYNTLLIANDILNHKITFLVDKESKLAFKTIASKNYNVFLQEHDNILRDIEFISPDIVINDHLDTSSEYMLALKELGIKTINFEDLGDGVKYADLVFNAMYPEKIILPKHYFGHEYFILRDEFLYSPKKIVVGDVKKVLITFGGVDPNNYTKKVLDAIYDYCQERNIKIMVIAGFGYNFYNSLKYYKNICVKKNVKNISYYMYKADLIFTSAGRTTFEIASIGTPAIVLAQNKRELTHFFASSEYGLLNLGLGYKLSNKQLLKSFNFLVNSEVSRKRMSELMKKTDLKSGRKKVNQIIQRLLED